MRIWCSTVLCVGSTGVSLSRVHVNSLSLSLSRSLAERRKIICFPARLETRSKGRGEFTASARLTTRIDSGLINSRIEMEKHRFPFFFFWLKICNGLSEFIAARCCGCSENYYYRWSCLVRPTVWKFTLLLFRYSVSVKKGSLDSSTHLLHFIPLATTKVNRNPSNAIFLVSLLIQRFLRSLDSTRPDPIRPDPIPKRGGK